MTKSRAKRFIEETKSNSSKVRTISASKIENAQLAFSARFFVFGNLVLHTKAISSIQKFQQSDTPIISQKVIDESKKNIWLTFVLLVAAAVLMLVDTGLPPYIGLVPLLAAYFPASMAFWLRALLKNSNHQDKDYFVEVLMSSGRRHKFFTASEAEANALTGLFLSLIASDDQGTVYRYDQSTKNIVVDNSDRSINATQVGDGLTLNMDVESDEQEA